MRWPATGLARLLVLCACAAFLPSATAQKNARHLAPAKIMHADSVFIDCEVCPRSLAVAPKVALEELRSWGRFRIVEDRTRADLIFRFSANPYLGDYITRDGPDKRPVAIDSIIMTVIDPENGANLWSDSRQWGSLRVAGAVKDLINGLRHQMEEQVTRWTLDDVLQCNGTAAYEGFALATPEEALERSGRKVDRIDGVPDRLAASSSDAPGFCRRVQLIIGSDGKIVAFEVISSEAELLEVDDVLEHADQFDFASGRNSDSQTIFFSARSKDQKILIRFSMEGRRPVLSRVTYFY
jgi:hypothetical protein